MTVAHDQDRPTLLDGWLLVEETVRVMGRAGSHDEAEAAARRTVTELRSTGRQGTVTLGHGPDHPEHAAVQTGVLGAALFALTGVAVRWEPESDLVKKGADERSDPDRCPAPARPGDVLCLARVAHPGTQDPVSVAEMSEVIGQLRASVRSEDIVKEIDGRDLLVVMGSLSLPVAWRRMSGLVGDRRCSTSNTVVSISAGLAKVGPHGPNDALHHARVALLLAVSGAGLIALARADQERVLG